MNLYGTSIQICTQTKRKMHQRINQTQKYKSGLKSDPAC